MSSNEYLKNQKMKVRNNRKIPHDGINNILIRGTNWIGDVVMSLPAVSAIRETFPHARLTVLAKPWVAEVYRISPDIDDVIVFESPGIHDGITGKIRLAKKLKDMKFDAAILLQNAIEAAIISCLARIPVRAGYNSDGRGFLLTHSVQRTEEIRKGHQIDYYLEMLASLGFKTSRREINITLNGSYSVAAENIFKRYEHKSGGIIVGVAPGAAYGPAKMWFPERFADVADRLMDEFLSTVFLFGSGGDRERALHVEKYAKKPLINLAGETSLKEAIAMIAQCDLFISNDSGLMHLAGALGVPLVAIFGSTNPIATSPMGDNSIVVRKEVSCSPCLKKICPKDFRCMDLIETRHVYDEAIKLLANKVQKKKSKQL